MKKAQFTLIEILVVVAIIMVLVGSIMAVMPRVMRKGKEAKTRAILERVAAGLNEYKSHYGYYPIQKDAPAPIDAVLVKVSTETGNVKDAWQQEVLYQYPSADTTSGVYDLRSIGADGIDGTDDDVKELGRR